MRRARLDGLHAAAIAAVGALDSVFFGANRRFRFSFVLLSFLVVIYSNPKVKSPK